MTNVNADSSQGGGGGNEPPPSPGPPTPGFHGGNKVYKSGPLFLSSKGIGWTSWKKRWFILTRTSLVFFRSDPNVIPQKGSEVNLTLGGIDLNSSGSVVVKEDKKLLTVLFPDGRDGRAFTLKAETLEDLHEWKTALEEALSDAPSAALAAGQNGKFNNDQSNASDASCEQSKDKQLPKSLVIGRPILLALEDIDGTPSFLEKALRFIEENGVKMEGILRQAADVDDVEHRIREFEKGKTEFSPDEDPHVIADCVKYVIRELPSSPVPASCCKALLEACRTDRSMRVDAMRSAICETFPEPNRRLLQRILMMMQIIASNKSVNRMSTSAVAACMAPLLLRPLLAGDCELENDFDVGGDGSVQLLQAAAAANHAQAIVITLLEEYENIFGEGSVSPEPYTDSEDSESESEEITDDDDDDDSFDDDGDDDDELDIDEDHDHQSSVTSSDTSENDCRKKVLRNHSSRSESPPIDNALEPRRDFSSIKPQASSVIHDTVLKGTNDDAKLKLNESGEQLRADTSESQNLSKPLQGPVQSVRRRTVWGRTPGKKNLSMESIDLPFDQEDEIRKLESTRTDLQNRIAKEAKANSLLQDRLERRKYDLYERRLALEKDVSRLQKQLQQEMELRTALEDGLRTSQQPPLSVSSIADDKMKAELEESDREEKSVSNLKQNSGDLELQLNQPRELNSNVWTDMGNHLNRSPNHQSKAKKKQMDLEALSTSSASDNSSRSNPGSYLYKLESPSSSRNFLPPSPQTDASRNSKASKFFTNAEMGTSRLSTTASKKSSTRVEGTSSTNSALSKLTNRLNFLKERRSQIANELQTLDKGRSSSQPVQNLEKGQKSEHSQLIQNTGKLQESKTQQSTDRNQMENNELVHKPNDRSTQDVDTGAKSETPPNLERGKSESFPTVDKGRSKVPPRTFSR